MNSCSTGYIIRSTTAGTIEPSRHIIMGTLVIYDVSAGCRELKRKLFGCQTWGDQGQLSAILPFLGKVGIPSPASNVSGPLDWPPLVSWALLVVDPCKNWMYKLS